MKHLNLCSLFVAVALLLGGISGCGGGASEKPTITVKPAEAEVVASNDSPSDDSDTDNAVQPDSSGYGTFKGYVTLTGAFSPRSEEHTSELQSRRNLVCRLLLEK